MNLVPRCMGLRVASAHGPFIEGRDGFVARSVSTMTAGGGQVGE
jgi:hypothetical protein